MAAAEERKKVVVLGGGVGAMMAAYELTHPAHDGARKYDVTVYQMGWRLGGKCASGRRLVGDDGKPAVDRRIEEHGLHIWLGFYRNAFGAMNDCYRELGRPAGSPLATIEDALKPQSFITFMDPHGGPWSRWDIAFAPVSGKPWEGDGPTAWDFVRMAIGWMTNALGREEPPPKTWMGRLLEHLRVGEAELAAGATALHFAFDSIEELGEWAAHHVGSHHDRIVEHLERFAEKLRRSIARHHFHDHDEARRMSQLYDVTVTALLGLFREGVLAGRRNFSDLDDEELREFLLRHGCHPESLSSPALTGYYDIAFAFEDGVNDDAHRNTGAGTAIHALLRMCCGYRGAFMWKMQAGMGDTVFGPLYQVLLARGVKFQFFHKVTSLEPDASGARIERVRIARQADVRGGKPYRPLFDVPMQGGVLPCWPDRPFYDQLVQGEALRTGGYDLESDWCDWKSVGEEVLEAGTQFDHVVLGVPVGALRPICRPILESTAPAAPRWQAMFDRVKTVQTQAMQLWFDRDVFDLGWERRVMPSEEASDVGLERTVLDAYADPFNSWADMTHLLAAEAWPPGAKGAPHGLIYLCGTLPDEHEPPPGDDPAFPKRQLDRVRAIAKEWLDASSGGIWPRATASPPRPPSALDWDRLVAPDGTTGGARLDAQWLTANIDGGERYVLSVKGSSRYRMKAGDTGFSNLVIAGDWVSTGFDVGCVEAATMGGMQASRAICGFPRRVVGEGQANPARRAAPRAYIARPGDEEMPLPYTFRGLTIRSLPLRADTRKLQAVCDRYLNIAPPEILEYRPLGGLVFLQVATYGSLASTSDPEGFFSENEISFNMLVARGRRENGRWRASDLAFYFPYIFVDNPWAIATGREVFGYPKAWSKLSIPDDPRHPAPVRLETMVLPTLSPETRLELLPLIEVDRKPESLLEEILHEVEGFGAALEASFLGRNGMLADLDPDLGRRLIQTVKDGRLPIVSLKQIRDTARPERACYQAIVSAVMRIEKIHGMGLLHGEYDVKIHRYASAPIVEELGLAVERDGTLRPRLAYWAKFDCTLGEGENLFVAGDEAMSTSESLQPQAASGGAG